MGSKASTISSSSCAYEAKGFRRDNATVQGQGIVQHNCDQFPGWGKTSAFQVRSHPSDPVGQDPPFLQSVARCCHDSHTVEGHFSSQNIDGPRSNDSVGLPFSCHKSVDPFLLPVRRWKRRPVDGLTIRMCYDGGVWIMV